MEFFDGAVNKTKEVFDVVTKKTGEVINTGKIKYEITSLKSKIEKDYKKLGKIYYEQLKEGAEAPDEVEEIIADIDQMNERIETLNIALAELKDCVVCPKCGATQKKDAVFCNACGEKIEQ